MNVKTIAQGSYQTNSYIITNDGFDNQCVVVDTGLENHLLLDYLSKNNLTPKKLLITHGHLDHILGIPVLKSKYPDMHVLIHHDDEEMLKDPQLNMSGHSAIYDDFTMDNVDVLLGDTDMIEEIGLKFRVIHIPGHTQGGMCLEVLGEGVVFTGDCIFSGSIGRTDFPGHNESKCMHQLIEGLKGKILTLDAKTILLPGHGPSTTVENEKLHNPFFSDDGFYSLG